MDYKNQYIGLTADQKLRTTFEIDLKDISVLRSFDPKAGTLQTTASILFKKLINELKHSTLEPGDFSSYQYAICNAHIVLGHGTSQTIHIGGAKYIRCDDDVQRDPATVSASGSVDSRAAETVGGDDSRRDKKLARKVKRP